MGVEIERKFLVADDSWRMDVIKVTPIQQVYLTRNSLLKGRIRIFGDQGFVTFKSSPRKSGRGPLVREEYDYEIPKADAVQMIKKCKSVSTIAKCRHELMHEGKRWSIDEYEGGNEGLIVAEVELATVDEAFVTPPWLGKEVTPDRRYGNSNLSKHPFSTWSDDGAE